MNTKPYFKKAGQIFFALLIFTTGLFAQRTISGKILAGDDKSGLIGATVVVKGTTNGTSTDFDGNFTLSVPNDASTLVVSSVGFLTREVDIASVNTVEVTLPVDVSTLEEIVVTGYASQRKKDITGAVTVVSAKELTAVPTASVTQMLQGRAAGVNIGNDNSPGGGTMVRIRGFGSINNNSPLFVIDGVPTQGTLNQLNPNDIESMQILKDASAASIYGARATNGVVIITTKKGKVGEPSITFDYYTGTQKPGRQLDLLNTQQLGQYLYLADIGAGKNPSVNSPSAQYKFGPSGEQTIADYIYPNVYGS
ncbi:MAG: TonB-dependent receptor plug domain-containing protein, partial [Saprospiraceae bacterium]